MPVCMMVRRLLILCAASRALQSSSILAAFVEAMIAAELPQCPLRRDLEFFRSNHQKLPAMQ
ncbi:hypothetical protein APZ00_18485 [Pannonibacter phragmitetus]|uniref:Secreted protein n=1 Tax=Pannonibacter phragmitetus TaxID=121719 RepID=A0A0U2W8K4_9HYPH|nr:hypothetical protein APZ00_18485 [Pannonibacter phragmitetus]